MKIKPHTQMHIKFETGHTDNNDGDDNEYNNGR